MQVKIVIVTPVLMLRRADSCWKGDMKRPTCGLCQRIGTHCTFRIRQKPSKRHRRSEGVSQSQDLDRTSKDWTLDGKSTPSLGKVILLTCSKPARRGIRTGIHRVPPPTWRKCKDLRHSTKTIRIRRPSGPSLRDRRRNPQWLTQTARLST